MKKPFFRKQTRAWYVWEQTAKGKKMVRLSKEKDEAMRLWHERQVRNQPVDNDTTVQTIVSRFLDWCRRQRSDNTYKWYKHYLDIFVQELGHMKVADLRTAHVEDWLDDQFQDCTDTARNGAVRAIVRPFNFALKRGQLGKSPLKGIERPRPVSRECYIQPEQWQKLLSSINDESLLDIVTVLRETGCRPHEARTVEARHVDRSTRAWVFETKESKGKRHRRVVPLTPAAWDITQRLMLKNPEGPLFRTKRGTPWSKDKLCRRLQRLARRTGIKATPYAIRHTYITDAIANGVDPVTVATIVGHKGLDMIMRVYQHVQLRTDHMQTALQKAVGG